jgi:HK97 family phage major capsid protein
MSSEVQVQANVRKVEAHIEQARLQAARLNLRREERQRYSLANALRCLETEKTHGGSFEAEISAELERQQQTTTANSILIPWWALKRDMTAAVAGAGGYLVESSPDVDSMVDALRGFSVIASLPITNIPNCQGNFMIPVESAGPTAYVLQDESTQITEGQGTLGQTAMSPKTVGAYTELSRQFLLMTGSGGEGYARRTLMKSVAAKVDALTINGSGTLGEPTGLISQITGSVSGTSLADAGIREFQTDIGDALGPDCGWVTTRTVASLLNGRQRFTGTDRTLWEGSLYRGTLGGWPAYSAPSVPASHLIFGAWGSLVLANWGPALEVAANPYADFRAGIVGVRCMASFDVGLVRPAAFSKATAVT